MELLVSLLLPDDDAKKGEKVTKSKCKSIHPHKNDDHDAEDQGNSDKRRGLDKGKGISFSSKQVRISTQRTSSDTGRRLRSDTRRRRSSDLELNEEELSKKPSLENNPGVDLESLKAEEIRLKVEHEKSKSQKITAKKPPKPKGIVIKESNSEANKSKSKVKSLVEFDPMFKGKMKVDNPNRIFLPTMDQEPKFAEEEI